METRVLQGTLVTHAGFPKFGVLFWGFPILRIIVGWGLNWGPPILRNCHRICRVPLKTLLGLPSHLSEPPSRGLGFRV